MKIIKPSFEILTIIDAKEMLSTIELAGRTCYKSEHNISANSAVKFVKSLIQSGHESALEHQSVSVRVICDRGISHEIVRHRIASYSQESTRYCNYGKSGSIGVITPAPHFKNDSSLGVWLDTMKTCESAYLAMLENGESAQIARSVLPHSLKTEIIITMNFREWRHFFKLRTSWEAHPQILEITRPLLKEFKQLIPVVFDDIYVDSLQSTK